jgi:hypothetical protein
MLHLDPFAPLPSATPHCVLTVPHHAEQMDDSEGLPLDYDPSDALALVPWAGESHIICYMPLC